MNDSRWSDAVLDEKRQRGDALADGVVDAIYRDQEVAGVNRLMATLMRNDAILPDGFPPIVVDYLERSTELPPADEALIAQGEKIFADFGPEILMVLGFYSLPSSYAAHKGVQVLYRTAYLTKRPVRRVLETTQMVIDVLSPGGLAPGGRGERVAQKVRLMHAAVRHLLRSDPRAPWDDALGVPINQEDLAGTLMTFSYVVYDGLSRLGIVLDAEEQAAYLHAFTRVGQLMGVDADLIPDTMTEAAALTRAVFTRQAGASPEGKAMMAALLEGLGGMLPISGLAPSAARFFLEKVPFTDLDIPTVLAIPPPNWSEHLLTWEARLGGLVHRFGDGEATGDLLRWASQHMVSAFLDAERGGQRPAFAIPQTLTDLWASRAKAGDVPPP